MKRKIISLIFVFILGTIGYCSGIQGKIIEITTATSAISEPCIYYIKSSGALLGGASSDCIVWPGSNPPTLNNAKIAFSGKSTFPISMTYSGDVLPAAREETWYNRVTGERDSDSTSGYTWVVQPGPDLIALIPSHLIATNTFAQSSSSGTPGTSTYSSSSYTNWTSSKFVRTGVAYTRRYRGTESFGFNSTGLISFDVSNIVAERTYDNKTCKGTLPTVATIKTKSCVYGSCTLINSTVEGAPFHRLNQ